MKNNRMHMADAINEVVNSDIAKVKSNTMKKLVATTSESLFLDVMMSAVSRIPYKEARSLSFILTGIRSALTSELLFKTIERKLSNKNFAKFGKLIAKQNAYTAKLLSSKIKGFSAQTRMNLVPLLMKLDGSTFAASSPFRTLFNKKNRKAMIDDVKNITVTCRPVVQLILDAYNARTESFKYVSIQKQGKKAAQGIISLNPVSAPVNYMHTEPQELMNMSVSLPVNDVTMITRAIESTVKMPFTFDTEYNKAVMTIIDTDLFRDLLAGNSSDTESIRTKVEQARFSVKEGVEFWEEIGRGTVYFDYVVDFRGRISQLGGLSAVGHKVGKAMLRSGEAHELGKDGYDNMLIALAGSMGLDKETFAVRLAYGREHVRTFTALGAQLITDPTGAFNRIKALGSDDAFDTATISLELHRLSIFNGNPAEFKSNIFVGYDATSSAVQLVGLIMGNDTLTEASNTRVGADTEDKIHDSYMLVADIMDLACDKLVDDDTAEYLNIWKEIDKKTKRAFAKPLLMTRLYGSKFLTHMDSCREVAVEKGILDAKDSRLNDFGKTIARLFNFAFDNEKGFNCLRSYEMFTKAIAKTYADSGQDVTWSVQDNTHFTAQVVNAAYYKIAGTQYTAYIDGKKHAVVDYGMDVLADVKQDLNYKIDRVVDKRRAVSAIAPNFIHHLDALVLHSVVNELDRPMRLTHDCFATTPGMVSRMSDAINNSYVNLFGNNNLKQIEKLQEECFNNTGVLVDLPNNYNAGGIDKAEIAAAIYKFS